MIDKNLLSNYQIVTLESFYNNWENTIVPSLFSEIILLKCRGYLHLYQYGALPFDTSDFFATHHLLCEKKEQKLLPIMGFKTVDIKTTEKHRMTFPALSIALNSKSPPHEEALNELIKSTKENNGNLNYGFSWTIHPKVRENPSLKAILKDIFCTILVHYYKNRPNEVHTCLGVPRFKTDQFFLWMGYQPMSLKKIPLESFKLSSLVDEPVFMFQCSKFSQQAEELAHQYKTIWENRLIIDEQLEHESKTIKKAA